MAIGVPTHFKPSNKNISACGIVNPKYVAYDGRDVDCIRCKQTHVFNNYMKICSMKTIR